MQYDDRTKAILQHTNQQPNLIKTAGALNHDTFKNNCENIIGAIKIPVGVAGPIKITGQFAKGEYILPMATTEACLVASTNRGCKALAKAKPIITSLEYNGISRAPVLKLKNPEKIDHYRNWFKKNLAKLNQLAQTTSSHIELKKFNLVQEENLLYTHFWFDTADAMGMNMATIASKAICDYLEQELDAQTIAISSNLCSDKKAATIHLEQPRGYSVKAKANLPATVIQEILKADPQTIAQVYQAKIKQGSTLAGTLGQNAHHANIIAAIFIATGQDPAHVVDSSLGKTEVKLQDDNLEISVTIPSLVCGTIGGGTKLPTQAEAIGMIGLKNQASSGEQAHEFAEVVAAAVLAGELSLLAAIASNHLADAHNQFRQNQSTNLTNDHE